MKPLHGINTEASAIGTAGLCNGVGTSPKCSPKRVYANDRRTAASRGVSAGDHPGLPMVAGATNPTCQFRHGFLVQMHLNPLAVGHLMLIQGPE